MNAMIFAAGLGTRLFPITKDKPKALAPFNGTTLLEYNLRFLSNQGVKKFVINTHHFADKIKEYLEQNNNFNLDITLSHENELLDTAGGLALASKYFGDNDDVLLYNVDVISDINIIDFYNFHKNNNAMASLAIRNRSTSRYFLYNDNNRLIGWTNKNTEEVKICPNNTDNRNEFAFSGIHFINMKLIKDLKVEKLSITPFYLEKACSEIITGYEHNSDIWIDCGKIETLAEAEKIILQ